MTANSTRTHRAGQHAADAAIGDGAEGNARLTSSVGMLLLVMLAVEGYTILDVRGMIKLHIALGLLLVGPIALKCATTIYRFTRYYSGAPAYQLKGPPQIILRLLGPVVIITSVAVLATGIGLVFTGRNDALLTAHQASFVIWFVAMAVHVLGHIIEAVRHTAAELRKPAVRRRGLRLITVAAAVLVGVGVTLAVYPSASAWTSGRIDHGHSQAHDH